MSCALTVDGWYFTRSVLANPNQLQVNLHFPGGNIAASYTTTEAMVNDLRNTPFWSNEVLPHESNLGKQLMGVFQHFLTEVVAPGLMVSLRYYGLARELEAVA